MFLGDADARVCGSLQSKAPGNRSVEGVGPGLGSARSIRGAKTKEALALSYPGAPRAARPLFVRKCRLPSPRGPAPSCMLCLALPRSTGLVEGQAFQPGSHGSSSHPDIRARASYSLRPALTLTPPPPRMTLTLMIFSVVAPDPGCTLGGLRLWQVAATRPVLPPTPLPSYSDCSSSEPRPSYLSHPTPLKPGVGT